MFLSDHWSDPIPVIINFYHGWPPFRLTDMAPVQSNINQVVTNREGTLASRVGHEVGQFLS